MIKTKKEICGNIRGNYNKFSCIRFVYWPEFKVEWKQFHLINNPLNNHSWEQSFVINKYQSLKEELTQNAILGINHIQWVHTSSKANLHLQTEYCKSMHCVNPVYPGIDEGSIIKHYNIT